MSAGTQSTKRPIWLRILIWLGIALLAILAILLMIGLWPAPTRGLQPDPNPTASHDEAVARFNEVVENEKQGVKESGQSILMTHGAPTDDVYVLVHGVTNAPREFQEFGKMLHEQGANVLLMRMPHHGMKSSDIRELGKLTPQQLREYADTAIDIAAGLGDNVTVIGLSGGATVASWMAQNREEVDRAVLISPFIGILQVPSFLDPFVANLLARLPEIVIPDEGEPEREWVYMGFESRGSDAFLQLGQFVVHQAEKEPPQARQILVLTTASDDVADNHWAKKLAEQWSAHGAEVATHEFPKSEKVPHASIDPSAGERVRNLVYGTMLKWLQENPVE
jgi:pimeloyl-ACP methyl ester carboxylesterase